MFKKSGHHVDLWVDGCNKLNKKYLGKIVWIKRKSGGAIPVYESPDGTGRLNKNR